MVDFVAVNFKPLKGGVPDADDIKAAEFTLRTLALKAGLDNVTVMAPVKQERNGVSYYTIEWHAADKLQAENASAEELANNESPC